MHEPSSAGLTIIGAGPAGISVLVAACNSGELSRLFAGGVTILEQRDAAGAGEIGDYCINSDSHVESFLRCLDAGLGRRFPELLRHPATRALQAHRGHAAPLRLVSAFVGLVAHSIQTFAASLGQPILSGMQALHASCATDGGWIVRARRLADGTDFNVTSRHLVIATGAEQSAAQLRNLSVAGQSLWPRYQDKLVLSRAILTPEGRDASRRRLSVLKNPHVAIVGGSHSAMSVAKLLLDLSPGVDWQPRSISILHRRPLKPMYPTPDLACAEGYDAFTSDDICRKTGRVFPLAGFRSDSRDLLLRIMGLGRRPLEQRIGLIDLSRGDAGDIAESLERADIIVAATGYRPRALPLFDQRGRRIKLLSEGSGDPVMVDDGSRVLDHAGRPIPGVFGIGLSAGFPLAGTHGEASFRGQANGLALWQAEIGTDIVRAVLDDATALPDHWAARRTRSSHEQGALNAQ